MAEPMTTIVLFSIQHGLEKCVC